MDLREIDSFGDVAAEDDDVLLEYFVSTDAVDEIASGKKLLVLGRKGTGKTALFRFFTEREGVYGARALNLRGYPWGVHAERVDSGAAEIDAYAASWRFLIAVEFASLVLSLPGAQECLEAKPLTDFLKKNYGGVDPKLNDIIRPESLRLEGLSIAPQILGNALGGIELARSKRNPNFGHEIGALSDKLFDAARALAIAIGRDSLSLHFDELDQGIATLEEGRKSMLTGLVIAARAVKRDFSGGGFNLNVVLYLRTDIWDQIEFSDKNKIHQTVTMELEWDSESLLSLINKRVRKKIGKAYDWSEISTSDKMRGTQEKWMHIVSRTFLRPRDVIQFLNCILSVLKESEVPIARIENAHIVNSREKYSAYLKSELDDEIKPHWPDWASALQVCSAIGAVTFQREEFEAEYEKRSQKMTIPVNEALEQLYGFSVIGYQSRSGYGGSGWKYKYSDPESPWDAVATRLKVHLGLKEYAKLQEERKNA